MELIERIESMGGALRSIESGFIQNEIADSAYIAQRRLEEKKSVVVGVNDFVEREERSLPIMVIDEQVEQDQRRQLQEFRRSRSAEPERRSRHAAALEQLDAVSRDGGNLMPAIIEAVRSEATVGEIVETMKRTFGEHREQGF
jgi:methylmalonyl-CoA mutase, N-terminal domain